MIDQETPMQLAKLASELQLKIRELPSSRARSLAETKLDECVMWLREATSASAEPRGH